MNTTLVIIPTYNERENLASMAARVLASVAGSDLLVVDDNSPDGTGALAEDLAAMSPRLHVVHRRAKAGLGAAYQEGFRWGLEHGYEVLVEMDGDRSHQPEQLPRLLDALASSDLAIGSRWVTGGAVENWPFRREALSRAGSLYARLALGLPYRDVTGGYRAFRASALAAIDFAAITSQGYCFQIDMLWRAHRAGLRVAEVPITFVERTLGVSKMSPGIVREAIAKVTVWGLTSLPGRLRGERIAVLPDARSPEASPSARV
jgi:dolichol-phosphate mannosyltransferase